MAFRAFNKQSRCQPCSAYPATLEFEILPDQESSRQGVLHEVRLQTSCTPWQESNNQGLSKRISSWCSWLLWMTTQRFGM
jgi:hypothetical protein